MFWLMIIKEDLISSRPRSVYIINGREITRGVCLGQVIGQVFLQRLEKRNPECSLPKYHRFVAQERGMSQDTEFEQQPIDFFEGSGELHQTPETQSEQQLHPRSGGVLKSQKSPPPDRTQHRKQSIGQTTRSLRRNSGPLPKHLQNQRPSH